jgi:hypothetical protein
MLSVASIYWQLQRTRRKALWMARQKDRRIRWISFEKANLKGVMACRVTDAGDIEGTPALREAYEMGRAI